MTKRTSLRFLMMVPLSLLLAAGMVLTEGIVRPGQTAEAANWQLYLSNTGEYCEGCCMAGSICCASNLPCRITPFRP